MEINIQSIKFIKPSKSTPENLRNFKLSLLDQLAPPSYINIILYYKSNCEVKTSDKCTQLVKSLSKVLTLFHPLAGRITEDGLMVDCSDQGVKYLETQVSTRLDDFLKQGPKIELINQLTGAPETTLVTIQVNIFDCGGLVIGVSGSHKVTDACNLVCFVNEWTSTNRTGTSNGDFYPCFDNLASIFPTRDVSSSSLQYSPITNDPGARIVTKRFVFDGTMIYKLRAKADSPSGKHKHSRVVLVTSLIWKALICIDKFKCRSFRDCLLSPALNLRGKVDLPISENSFGNVWAPYPVRLKQNEMESKFVDLVTSDKASAKKPTAKDPTATSFKTAPFGAGAGANPSEGGNAIDAVAREGGAPIGSDEGETITLEGEATEEGDLTTDSDGDGETGDGDGVGALKKVAVSGAGAGYTDAIAVTVNNAIENRKTLKEAIAEKTKQG